MNAKKPRGAVAPPASAPATPRSPAGVLAALMEALPMLVVEDGVVDLQKTDPLLIQAIVENAQAAVGVATLGMAAIGNLIVDSSPEIEDGSIGQPTVEALGWLLAELGALAGLCAGLANQCGRPGVSARREFVPQWVETAMQRHREAVARDALHGRS